MSVRLVAAAETVGGGFLFWAVVFLAFPFAVALVLIAATAFRRATSRPAAEPNPGPPPPTPEQVGPPDAEGRGERVVAEEAGSVEFDDTPLPVDAEEVTDEDASGNVFGDTKP